MIKSKIPAQLLLINTALPNPVSSKQTIQPWKWELFTHTVRRSATSSSHRDVKFLTKQESSLSLSSSQFKSITFPLCSNMTTHWKALATQAWGLETKSKGSSSNFSFLWASKQWAFAPNVPLPPTAQHLNRVLPSGSAGTVKHTASNPLFGSLCQLSSSVVFAFPGLAQDLQTLAHGKRQGCGLPLGHLC